MKTQSIKYILVATITTLLTIAMTVFAAYPATPYAPGDELDPSCNHGDSNCYVDIGVSASNGLSIDGTSGDVKLGGILFDPTSIFLNGGSLTVEDSQGIATFNISEGFVGMASDGGRIEISDSSLNFATPDVVAGGANNGQVLTLVDASTGEVEFQDGGDCAYTEWLVTDGPSSTQGFGCFDYINEPMEIAVGYLDHVIYDDGSTVITKYVNTLGTFNIFDSKGVFFGYSDQSDGVTFSGSQVVISAPEGIQMPRWDTPSRPSVSGGVIGYNTDLSQMEYYNGTTWVQF
ncbi:hypothetical protein H6776_01115 [Candidatus Nomurabacteria bacterium]|nr:hypothetical protein [Candidatus Nomurabacteria bacterium]